MLTIQPSPTVQQALDAAKLIEKFLLFLEDDSTTSQDMHKILKIIQNKYWHSKKRQAKRQDICVWNNLITY